MHTLKVLILEDHPFQLMALHQMLNANGVFDVLVAESVDSAKQMLDRRGPVDIAICDLYMDGSDGLALIRYLAEHRLTEALIVLSDAEPALLEKVGDLALQLGMRLLGCVSKPASGAVLHQLLREYRDRPDCGLMSVSPRVFELDSLSDEQLARTREQWRVQYQPRLCAEGHVVGVEASVRWQHPTLGELAPGQFFTLLNGGSLLAPLTWHVLEEAVAFAATSARSLPVSVNLPPALLPDRAFIARLADLLVRCELPATHLTLEMRYSHCQHMSGDEWKALQHLGCRLSLDGFDSQATPLPQLAGLPLSELKLSADLIRGMADDGKKIAAVAAALILARRLDLQILVSGVDTHCDWRAVRSLGHPVVQGTFVAAPLVADELLKWLDAHEPAARARKERG